ncbi:MAG: HAMP domain-containing protein [Desulfatitalea sp.]|nr:HAMP domain-containing protein [Desulfatitalea sp.]
MGRSLAFRLTLWYATIFALSAAVAFSLFYVLIAKTIDQRTDADLLAHANQLAQIHALEGDGMLQRAAMLQAQAAGEKKMFFRLLYPSGLVFSSSNMLHWGNVGLDRNAVDALFEGHRHSLVTQVPPGRTFKARVLYMRLSGNIILQLGASLEEEARLLQTFVRIFLFTMAGLLVLGVGVGWFMARRALSGVESVTRTARQISESDLDTRVPLRHRYDEIDRLAITFNQMLDRIRRLVTGMRQMNDNIAHDLRSPIARIRGLAEVTLTHEPSVEAYGQMAASTIEECDRLLDMINTMLAIARTEAGAGQAAFKIVDMAALVRAACDLFQPLAEDKGIALQCAADEPCRVDGDESMLQRMLANLIDNAIKYTDAGGKVTVAAGADQGGVRLMVTDTGMGIAPADQNRVFDRFYRGDRSRCQAGAGLGLSLAQTVAQAHGGRINLQSAPGQGSTFEVQLPASG